MARLHDSKPDPVEPESRDSTIAPDRFRVSPSILRARFRARARLRAVCAVCGKLRPVRVDDVGPYIAPHTRTERCAGSGQRVFAFAIHELSLTTRAAMVAAMMAEHSRLVGRRSELERDLLESWQSSGSLQRYREVRRELHKVDERIAQLEQTKSVGQLLGTRRPQ